MSASPHMMPLVILYGIIKHAQIGKLFQMSETILRTLILTTTLWQKENYCHHLQRRKVKHKELVSHVARLVHLLKQPPKYQCFNTIEVHFCSHHCLVWVTMKKEVQCLHSTESFKYPNCFCCNCHPLGPLLGLT